MGQETDRARLERLRTIPLFAGLNDDMLKDVLAHSTEFEAAEGHVLAERNQPGAGLFVIEEGRVTVDLANYDRELGPGEFFGELALLLEDERHTARVCAATPLRALAIRRDDFDTLLENEPKIAAAMLRTLAKRLAERK